MPPLVRRRDAPIALALLQLNAQIQQKDKDLAIMREQHAAQNFIDKLRERRLSEAQAIQFQEGQLAAQREERGKQQTARQNFLGQLLQADSPDIAKLGLLIENDLRQLRANSPSFGPNQTQQVPFDPSEILVRQFDRQVQQFDKDKAAAVSKSLDDLTTSGIAVLPSDFIDKLKDFKDSKGKPIPHVQIPLPDGSLMVQTLTGKFAHQKELIDAELDQKRQQSALGWERQRLLEVQKQEKQQRIAQFGQIVSPQHMSSVDGIINNFDNRIQKRVRFLQFQLNNSGLTGQARSDLLTELKSLQLDPTAGLGKKDKETYERAQELRASMLTNLQAQRSQPNFVAPQTDLSALQEMGVDKIVLGTHPAASRDISPGDRFVERRLGSQAIFGHGGSPALFLEHDATGAMVPGNAAAEHLATRDPDIGALVPPNWKSLVPLARGGATAVRATGPAPLALPLAPDPNVEADRLLKLFDESQDPAEREQIRTQLQQILIANSPTP